MAKGRSRAKPQAKRAGARPPTPAGKAGGALGERTWIGLGSLSVLLLAYACRGAPFGVPVADDYVFLYWLRFHRPFDLFDSMGAPFYWRPLTRQLYYTLLQGVLFAAPWLVAVLHGALFVGVYLAVYRVARRFLSAPLAAAAAAFPLFAEPSRALLVWPTQIQYLLPMLCAALAVDAALAGHRWRAALATLATLLGHEWGVMVVAALPVLAWFRTRRARETAVWTGIAAAVLAVWGVGHRIAESHGAILVGPPPPGVETGAGGLAVLARTLGRALVAQLNLEDAPPGTAATVGWAYGLLFALAALLALRKPAARRLARHWPALAGSLVWWLAGVAPLALIVVGWNDWRTTLPGLWLGLALVGFLGLVEPWLAAGFVALRVAALLACPLAPSTVAFHLPKTTSTIAFALVARQQRVVESTRQRLAESYPRLPRGAAIGYWSRFPMIEIAFYGQMAPRVWYADSTLTWRWLWEPGRIHGRVDAAVSYNVDTADPAVVIAPAALARAREAIAAYDAGHYELASQLAQASTRAQPVDARELDIWVARTGARAAYQLGDLARADSLNGVDQSLAGETPHSLGMSALLALRLGNLPLAQQMIARALQLEPDNAFARRVAALVETAAVQR